MPIVASCLPLALLRPTTPAKLSPAFFFRHRFLLSSFRLAPSKTARLGVFVSPSAASFDELDTKGWSNHRSPKKSVLSDLIQEVEPLDFNLIQKDVPPVTVDAMKRTISGMLGILPSDRFNVVVEALWVHLFKLLVSSMMTGYTLRNADYRLFLEKNLEIFEDHRDKGLLEKDELKNMIGNDLDKLLDRTPKLIELPERRDDEQLNEDFDYESLGEMSSEAKEYIRSLKCRLSSVEKDLHEVNKKNSALQMQQFVGEEKNDLLDYLRSLQPEKVLELSEPSHSDVQEIIYSVAHGLLATLSPKIHSKPPPQADNIPGSALSTGKDDCAELLENTSIHLQPLISVARDYLARLLFWCLLLGHYIRGLEHRLEMTQLLTVASDPENIAYDDDDFN